MRYGYGYVDVGVGIDMGANSVVGVGLHVGGVDGQGVLTWAWVIPLVRTSKWGVAMISLTT